LVGDPDFLDEVVADFQYGGRAAGGGEVPVVQADAEQVAVRELLFGGGPLA
jgi:hypothetical protein